GQRTDPRKGSPQRATPGGPGVPGAPAAESPDAAPPPAAAAAPAAPAVLGPDAAIAEQLRELGNGKFDRIIGGKNDRTPIEAFYSSRNYAPLWIADGKPNARARAGIGDQRPVYEEGRDA